MNPWDKFNRIMLRTMLKARATDVHPLENDEEVWRTSEEGRHFKIESTTGEIKAGFGGKLNGTKAIPKSERLKPSMKGVAKPKRPRKSDFSDEAQYEEARAKYKADRAKYDKRLDDVVESELKRQRRYDTPEKVKDWAKERNVRIDDDVYSSVDPRLLSDIVEVQDEMLERFPEVKAYQDKYYPYGIGSIDDKYCEFDAGQGIRIPVNHWNEQNYAASLRGVLESSSDGLFAQGDGTIKTTIRHEFGHGVDSFIRSKFSGLELTSSKDKTEVERRNNARREYEDTLTKLTITHSTSEYAKTNYYEAFAEGFAEYTSNPESDYGKAFGAFMQRWYNWQ